MSAVTSLIRQRVAELGLHVGTAPENLAAWRLHHAGHEFQQQYRVGRYRLDFAWPSILVALEVDGPHHHRPDVAHKDALRDAELRAAGWVIFRINSGEFFEQQLARVSRIVHQIHDDA